LASSYGSRARREVAFPVPALEWLVRGLQTSEDFRIVDRVFGQARGSKTLSGGEALLASLLALGLGELAARGGGRLEALSSMRASGASTQMPLTTPSASSSAAPTRAGSSA
jgi:hypothetical protein